MQKIVYADAALKEPENLFSDFKIKKYMLVCGKSYDSLAVKNLLESQNIPFVRFSDFKPNPLYEDVCAGVELFNRENCDGIIAVGGGSAIDVAKCIKLYCPMKNDDCYLNQEYKDSKIPLIAIPTTAGTGSESTRFAVIYYNGVKQSVAHESLVPDMAVLIPEVLEGLPIYQKKCTLMDALGQAIESWWSVNSTDESKAYSKEAVEIISKNYSDYLFYGKKLKEILYASNLAGRAINITQTTAAHAMSYKLTSLYGFPHGHSVSLCLPVVWEFMLNNMDSCIDKRGSEYLMRVFADISVSLGCSSPEDAIERVKDMISELELHKPESSNRSTDIKTLSDSVNLQRLANNPVNFSYENLTGMYERIVI